MFWAAHQLILLSTKKRISECESDGFWAWNLLYFLLINFFCLSELKILSRMLNRMMNKTNLYFNIDLRYFKIYNLSILASALLSYWLRFHWISFLTKSILTNSQSIRKPFCFSSPSWKLWFSCVQDVQRCTVSCPWLILWCTEPTGYEMLSKPQYHM